MLLHVNGNSLRLCFAAGSGPYIICIITDLNICSILTIKYVKSVKLVQPFIHSSNQVMFLKYFVSFNMLSDIPFS